MDKTDNKILTRITELITAEAIRQKETINLIASENYGLTTAHTVVGSVLAHKYAEGTPGNRYYAGCEIVDQIEHIAEQEVLNALIPLDKRSHYTAHVQPHAGSPANYAIYHALLKPHDTLLSMSLDSGGHLTHGHKASLAGMLYSVVHYTVEKTTHTLNFEHLEKLAQTHKPKLIIAGASAYPRSLDFKKFKQIADNVGAYLLADISHIAGLIAAGIHPNPAPYADVIMTTTHKTLGGPRGAVIMAQKSLSKKINRALMPGIQGGPFMDSIAAKALTFSRAQTTAFKEIQHRTVACAHALATALCTRGYTLISGGTDTHLLLVDLRTHSVKNGAQAEQLLAASGIICNRNVIPFDTQPVRTPSGIRLGLAALATRGAQPEDMQELAHLIDCVLSSPPQTHKLAVQQFISERLNQ